MRGRALCISSGSDVAQHGASGNPIAYFQTRSVGVEMCVVVNAPARTDHRHGLTAETIQPDLENVTIRRGKYRCSLRCENVLTFMTAVYSAWSLPRVGDLFL